MRPLVLGVESRIHTGRFGRTGIDGESVIQRTYRWSDRALGSRTAVAGVMAP